MEVNKKPWPILSVSGFKSRIDTNPDFQRPAVWRTGQKQFLVDTVLRGYDVPKLCWRKISKAPEKYEVVDGQQRLRTIFEFHAGEFHLAKDAFVANLSASGRIDLDAIFANPIYARLIGDVEEINRKFDGKLREVVDQMQGCFKQAA